MPEPIPSTVDRLMALLRERADGGIVEATHADLREALGITNRWTLTWALRTLIEARRIRCLALRRGHNPSKWLVYEHDGTPGHPGWRPWTEQSIARLRELRAAGLKLSEIATQMDLTEGQVIGKIQRLRIPLSRRAMGA